MNTLYLILMIIALHNIVLAEFDEIIRALKTFIVRRHVQTVTAADTCWSFGKNSTYINFIIPYF